MTFAQILAAVWLGWGLWILGRCYTAAHVAAKTHGSARRAAVEMKINALPWLLLAVLLALVVLL